MPENIKIIIWKRFANSGLVSGAWRGMEWGDLPEHEQSEFTSLFADVLSAGGKGLPLARIEIEQIESNRWIAEVEAGDFSHFKRHHLAGRSYAEVAAAVERIMQPVESVAVERVAPVVSPGPAAEAPAADIETPETTPRRGRPPRAIE